MTDFEIIPIGRESSADWDLECWLLSTADVFPGTALGCDHADSCTSSSGSMGLEVDLLIMDGMLTVLEKVLWESSSV